MSHNHIRVYVIQQGQGVRPSANHSIHVQACTRLEQADNGSDIATDIAGAVYSCTQGSGDLN